MKLSLILKEHCRSKLSADLIALFMQIIEICLFHNPLADTNLQDKKVVTTLFFSLLLFATQKPSPPLLFFSELR